MRSPTNQKETDEAPQVIREYPHSGRPEMPRGHVLRKALEVINGERQDQYGNPEDAFPLIAELWEIYLRVPGVVGAITPKDVAIMMVLFKIAREIHQHKQDNLVDAAGYLGLAGDLI